MLTDALLSINNKNNKKGNKEMKQEKYKEYLKYTSVISKKHPGKVKISPSSFSGYLQSPGTWYEQQILKKNTFKGNQSSTIGTLLHGRAEAHYYGQEPDRDAEDAYIEEQLINGVDLDMDEVKVNTEAIWEQFRTYLDKNQEEVVSVEGQLIDDERYDNIYTAGSYDRIIERNGKRYMVDFKSTGRKPSKLSSGHFIQGLEYAGMSKEKIDAVMIVYLVAPTKTIPARIIEMEKDIEPGHYTWLYKQMEILDTKFGMLDSEELVDILFHTNPLRDFANESELIAKTDEETERENIIKDL